MKKLFVLVLLVLLDIGVSNADSFKLTEEEKETFNSLSQSHLTETEKACLSKVRSGKALTVTENTSAVILASLENDEECDKAGQDSKDYAAFYYSMSCKRGNKKGCELHEAVSNYRVSESAAEVPHKSNDTSSVRQNDYTPVKGYWTLTRFEGNYVLENKNNDRDVILISLSSYGGGVNQQKIVRNKKEYFVSYKIDFLNIGCNCLLHPVNTLDMQFEDGTVLHGRILNVSLISDRIVYDFVPDDINLFLKSCQEKAWIRFKTVENNFASECYTDFFLSGFKEQMGVLFKGH